MFGHKKNGDTLRSNDDNITLIGENSTIDGNITATAYVKIDGKVLGNLTIEGSVTLGKDAYVKGNISSGEVVIYGRVDGNLKADSLQLKSSAIILGDIEAKTLQIDPGSIYQGMVRMQVEHPSS